MKKTMLILCALAFMLFSANLAFGQADSARPKTIKEAEAQKEAQAEAEMKKSNLTADAVICAEVIERMPSGAADNFPADIGQVCLWSKIFGSPDTTAVFHVWYFGDKEMARVELPVKSNAYRTYSTKRILPSWTGNWHVDIEDANGVVLKSVMFKIGAIE